MASSLFTSCFNYGRYFGPIRADKILHVTILDLLYIFRVSFHSIRKPQITVIYTRQNLMWNSGGVPSRADIVLCFTVSSGTWTLFISPSCHPYGMVFILLDQDAGVPILGSRIGNRMRNKRQTMQSWLLKRKCTPWSYQRHLCLFPIKRNLVPQPHEVARETGKYNSLF